jgi:hypothetical protein
LLRIEDHVSGEFESAEARLHFSPEVLVRALGPAEFALTRGGEQFATIVFVGAHVVEIEQSSWHPRFGERLVNLCLAARFEHASLETRLTWIER